MTQTARVKLTSTSLPKLGMFVMRSWVLVKKPVLK
ncbi:MAG: hypothetical protein CM1200mP11_4010 [Nitrosopumilaceae archaeon]|nr:MAG: hypothetical protein CM1200mP11_4010 [Nitrosopumilaceae archaeon]